MNTYDVCVVGGGVMGSFSALALSRRGLSVVLLDERRPPHNLGSSQGRTRIIREAYWEHPLYVPLVQRAYALWSELEAETGRRIVTQTGGLMIGLPDGDLVGGAIRSADEHRLPYEELSPRDVSAAFPAFELPEDFRAVFEPRAGVVHADAAIQVALRLSRTAGADHKFGEKALWWGRRGGGLVVETDRDTYTVGKVVLAAGPWIAELVSLGIELTAARQPLLWFAPVGRSETFTPSQFPVYLWQRRDRTIFYGFPLDETGLKVARHHRGERTAPAILDRTVSDRDVEIVRSFLADAIPGANGRFITGSVCMYTNAPDGHFVIDRLPSDDDVIIVSPCSGHGFKFAPAIGELVADIVGAEASTGDSPFKIDRDVVPDPSLN